MPPNIFVRTKLQPRAHRAKENVMTPVDGCFVLQAQSHPLRLANATSWELAVKE